MERNVRQLIGQMTLEEKAGMCSGLDFWHLKPVERLGVPSVMVSDGPHGLRKQEEGADHLGINRSISAVCFPPAVLTACSFDRVLLRELGSVIGKEAQAQDVSVILGPAVNIKRSPLCGRNFEYYSEDPYLSGQCASAFIRGVQEHHVGTSVKHFAANNQEYNRMSSSSNVDERTLREIYLPAFETAVKEAAPYTVMCSYNKINGTFASENQWLLTDVLRTEWNFKGYVMSDWGAVNDRVAALKAGLDLEMPSSGGMTDREIIDAVRSGSLDEDVLDRAVERILNVIFQWTDHRENQTPDLISDHMTAKRIAEESMVLLKNDGILPLREEEHVAFIGGFAAAPRYQGGGSSHVNSFRTDSVLDSLSGLDTITYAEGFSAEQDFYDPVLAAEAIEAAARSDKAVIFAGLPESFESEGYDRKHMRLPDCQNRLIREILSVQPNTAVVLHNGSPVELPWLSDVRGILEAYLGGQAGGSAVADLLYGKCCPCGKLAETFPLKLSDNPSYLNFGDREEVNYNEGIFVGYRYYEAKEMPVAFPFGFGLSYTTFAYSALETDRTELTEADTVTVSIDVTNTGNVPGKEIVQLYVSDLTGACRRPLKELKGFEKVSLEPGETKTVTMTLDFRSFAWYSTDLHDWYAQSGEYEILIGASSQDIRLRKKIRFTGTGKLPLHIHMNTTFAELLSDDRTAGFGKKLKAKMDAFFGVGEDTEDEERRKSDAVSASVPVRNVSAFGLMDKAELQAEIDRLNRTFG